MRNLFIYLLLLSSILGFGQSVDGVKAKKIDGIELVSPQSTFEYAENVSQEGLLVEQLDCVYDGLNRMQGTEGFMMIPSGYESSALIPQIPSKQSLEFDDWYDHWFDVTRASTATRVNDKNVIVTEANHVPRIDYSDAIFTETEPESINLALHSEDMTNAVWVDFLIGTGISPVRTANFAQAPDGTMTADRIQFDKGTGVAVDKSMIRQIVSITSEESTGSFWVKSNEGSDVGFRMLVGANTFPFIATTEWQIFENSTILSGNELGIGVGDFEANQTADILVWAGQLSPTDELTRYVPTTTAIAGVPPLYDMEGCGVLLTEPQSTNLVLWSEDYSNVAYTKSNLSVITNQSIGSGGFMTMDKLTSTANGGLIFQSVTSLIGDNVSVSIDFKIDNGDYVQVVVFDGTNRVRQDFILSTGLVGGNFDTGVTNIRNVKMIKINNVYRCSYTYTSISTTQQLVIYPSNSANGTSSNNGFSLFSDKVQIEIQEISSSYIKTEGSTVTRLKDEITNGGTVNDFNSEEGVLYCEIAGLSNDGTNRYLTLNDGTSTNRIGIIWTGNTNQIRCLIYDGSVQYDFSHTVPDITQITKVALKYKLNDFAMYVNGVEVNTSSSGGVYPVNTLNSLDFNLGSGSLNFYGKTKQIKVYKSIADAQKDLPYITN